MNGEQTIPRWEHLTACGWAEITATDLHERAKLLGVPASWLLP